MTTATKGRTTLILASASPRRSEILARLGFPLVIDPSAVPEPERRPGELPSTYAVRAARAKARDVAGRHRSGWIVGADTIVVARDHFLGKPACDMEAAGMLRSLSGRWHEVYTGLCLIDRIAGQSASGCSCSRVHFRRLTADEIAGYLSTGEHRDKAGAYAVQGFASIFIDRIEGCYFNIVGFPIFTFARLCRRLGWAIMP
jgi:septum formation protein